MAQTDLLKRYLDAGVAFTQLTQQKAEEIVRDLVKAGEVQAGEASTRVTELVERSRQNTEGILALVRAEVQSQVAKLGLVPKKDLDAVRQELAELKAQGEKVAPTAPAKAAAPVAKKVGKKPSASAPVQAAATKAPAAAKKAAKKKA